MNNKEDEIYNGLVHEWNLICLLVRWDLVKSPDWKQLEKTLWGDWANKLKGE